ncbi:hypothetical protein VPHD479_0190 [Vibrio phage D479]
MNEADDPNKCFHHTVGGAQVGDSSVCRDHFPDQGQYVFTGNLNTLPISYNVDVNIKDVAIEGDKLVVVMGSEVATTSTPDTRIRLPMKQVREIAQVILQTI